MFGSSLGGPIPTRVFFERLMGFDQILLGWNMAMFGNSFSLVSLGRASQSH